MKGPLLIVILRSPVLGQVKTRLAATVGDQRALEVYERLMLHTLRAAGALACTKQAWYADAVPEEDPAVARGFTSHAQVPGDLGARMEQVFDAGFAAGHGPIVIIGTDLPELSTALLERAFAALKEHDAVLGPATDGGYYLLGLNAPLPAVFRDKSWSTSDVLARTIEDLVRHRRSYFLLPELRDVDTEADLAGVELP